MATNRRRANGRYLRIDAGAARGSGDPVLSGQPCGIGELVGVALNNADVDGFTVIDTRGVYALDVTGDNGSPAAIAAGDVVYMDLSTGTISSATGGVRFGVALEDVGSGATTEILVRVGY